MWRKTELSLGGGAAVARCAERRCPTHGFSPVCCRMWKLWAVIEAAASFSWLPLVNFNVSPLNRRKS